MGEIERGALEEIQAAVEKAKGSWERVRMSESVEEEEEEDYDGWVKEEPELHGMNISLPESQSVLRIGPSELFSHGERTEVMRIESPFPYPGPLRRLAYWILLGWKWERP